MSRSMACGGCGAALRDMHPLRGVVLAALIDGADHRCAARGLRARIAAFDAGAAFRRFLGEVFKPGARARDAVLQSATR